MLGGCEVLLGGCDVLLGGVEPDDCGIALPELDDEQVSATF